MIIPHIGELWKYVDLQEQTINVCIISNVERTGGQITYTVHWLYEQSDDFPKIGWQDEHFQSVSPYPFRKLS